MIPAARLVRASPIVETSWALQMYTNERRGRTANGDGWIGRAAAVKGRPLPGCYVDGPRASAHCARRPGRRSAVPRVELTTLGPDLRGGPALPDGEFAE